MRPETGRNSGQQPSGADSLRQNRHGKARDQTLIAEIGQSPPATQKQSTCVTKPGDQIAMFCLHARRQSDAPLGVKLA